MSVKCFIQTSTESEVYSVLGHSFLWKYYVEHGDPSVGNMMYDPETQCGVLTDFDLSLLQWEPRVIGTDRTGTIPFMALDLLSTEYWNGKIKRFHHHELESFIWILTYVFLLYDAGIRKPNKYVDSWRTSDYITCAGTKLIFYRLNTLTEAAETVPANFKNSWPLAAKLCSALFIYHASLCYEFFSSEAPSRASSDSNKLWDSFITVLLGELETDVELHKLVCRLRTHKPSFEDLKPDEQDRLRTKFSAILQRPYEKST